MDRLARGVVANVAVSATIPVMYAINKGALKLLFDVNVAVAKALLSLVMPPQPEPDRDCSDCKTVNENP